MIMLVQCSLLIARDDFNYSNFCEEYKKYEKSVDYAAFCHQTMQWAKDVHKEFGDIERRKEFLERRCAALKEDCFMNYLQRRITKENPKNE